MKKAALRIEKNSQENWEIRRESVDITLTMT